jgi:hypothetical protein
VNWYGSVYFECELEIIHLSRLKFYLTIVIYSAMYSPGDFPVDHWSPSTISLSSLPPVGTDLHTNILSRLQTGLALTGAGAMMFLETYIIIKLCDGVYAAANHVSPKIISSQHRSIARVSVCVWQALSYILSPSILRRSGRAWSDSDSAKAEKLWKDASPIQKLPIASYEGGQVLSWGLPGKILFAPCMWKMAWAGKTVYSANYVDMLEFKAINCIPVTKYSLGVPGSASVMRSMVDGIESMAFCYKYLPIVDHLRRVDERTIIGKMMIGNASILYFTLTPSSV